MRPAINHRRSFINLLHGDPTVAIAFMAGAASAFVFILVLVTGLVYHIL
jgi:hypothetical protein